MANTRLSDLSAGGAFAATDLVYVVELAGTGGVKKTGTQLEEYIRDTVATFVTAGTGISVAHNDSGNTLTVSSTITQYTDADAVGAVSDAITGNGMVAKTAADTFAARSIAAGAGGSVTISNGDGVAGNPTISRAALTGDVTASADSNTTVIANGAVTYAKIQNVSATDKLLGRSTAGAGVVEEIACTAAGRAIIDDNTAADQRATLALGPAWPTAAGTLLYRFATGNLADDTAFSFAMNNGASVFAGFVKVVGNVTASGVGEFFARAASGPSITLGWEIGTVFNIVAGDGTLTGTTGPDASVNIRTDSSGNFYLENRSGSTRSWVIYVYV